MAYQSYSLADGQRLLAIGDAELWHRYLALGGDGDLAQLRAHVADDTCADAHEHNVIAQALNDVFVQQGRDHPVRYRHLYRRDFD